MPHFTHIPGNYTHHGVKAVGRTYLAAVVFLSAVQSARSTTITWEGGNGLQHLWANTLNWSPAAVPGGVDTAVFVNDLGGGGAIDLGGNRSVQRVSYRGSYSPQFNNGTLSVLDAIEVRNGITLDPQHEIGQNVIALRTVVSESATLQLDDSTTSHLGTLTLNSGTLDVLKGRTLQNSFVLEAGGGTISGSAMASVGGNVYPTLAGAISGAGQLAVEGSLTLAGFNTQVGGTLVESGSVVTVGTDSALGASGVPLTLKNGSHLRINNNMSMSRSIQLASTLGSGKTLDTQQFTLIHTGAFDALGPVGASVTKTGTGTLIMQGVPNDAIDLWAQDGLTLLDKSVGAASNSFGAAVDLLQISGAATIVRLGQSHQIRDSNSLGIRFINGGTFDMQNFSEGVASVSLINSQVIGATGSVLTIGNAASGIASSGNSLISAQQLLLPGVTNVSTAGGTLEISSSIPVGGLAVQGGGTLRLTGFNAFAGGTNVTLSTLVGDAASIGTGPVALDGGWLTLSSGSVPIGNGISIGANGAAIDTQGFNVTLAGQLTGSGLLHKFGSGDLRLTGANARTGETRIASGRLIVQNTSSLAGSVLNLDLSDSGTVGFESVSSVALGGLKGSRPLSLQTLAGSPVTANLALGGASYAYAGDLSGSGDISVQGGGMLTLSGTNTQTGGLSILGSTVLANTRSLGGGPVVSDGGWLAIADAATDVANSITIAGGGMAIQTFGQNPLLHGPINGPGHLHKFGAGSLRLAGNNGFTGETRIIGGSIILENGNSLAGSVLNLDVNDSGTLAFQGIDAAALGGLKGGRDQVLQNSAGAPIVLTVNTSNPSSTYSGRLLGPGSVRLIGGGTMIFSGVNSHSGGTVVTASTLFADGTTLGSGPLTLEGGYFVTTSSATMPQDLVLSGTGGAIDTQGRSPSISGHVTGPGTLNKVNDGTLTLTGGNTYSGGTVISRGAIAIGSDSHLGDLSGVLTLNGGTLQQWAPIASGRAIVVGPTGGVIDTGSFSGLYDGPITGPGQLVKTGAGTVTIRNVANSLAGGVQINEGSVDAWPGATLGSGAVSIASGASLKGTPSIASTLNNGGLLQPGGSIGSVNVGGDFNNTGRIEFELASPSSFDRISVAGQFHSTGTIAVVLGSFTPGPGSTFDLMDFSTFVDGGMAFDFSLAPLASGLAWNTSNFGTTGAVRVVSILQGDFNADGQVDGADLLLWQRGLSPNPNSPGDLATWKTNFGASSGVPSVATVPEPGIGHLVASFGTSLAFAHARRARRVPKRASCR